MSQFLEKIIKKASKRKSRICFADYNDERVYRAIKEIAKLKLAKPVIVGEKRVIEKNMSRFNIKKSMGIEVCDLKDDELLEKFSEQYMKLRKNKEKLSLKEARTIIKKPNYFAVMLLYNKFVDGVVSGLSSETKPFLPAFKIIKTKKNVKRVSSVFIMDFPDKTLFFADCAVNILPDKNELAEIAVLTSETVKSFGFKPRVAMLSFSTRGSAKHELVDKVREATRIAKRKKPELIIDGEIQFDAAFVPKVFKKKCPDSPLKGKANTFIFPDLNAGNISYKLVERLAGAKAIGPILQGLNLPVNDVSRGASYKDLVHLAAITSIQSRMKK